MFKLEPGVRKQYRELEYDPDARREFSMLPFGAFVWADEHPGGDCMLPDLDDQSRTALYQLVAARTALWLSGRIPGELQEVWDEARKALPNWPGFARLTIPDVEQEIIRSFALKMDAFEEELRSDADEFTKSTDAAGVTRITATYDLTKLEDGSDGSA